MIALNFKNSYYNSWTFSKGEHTLSLELDTKPNLAVYNFEGVQNGCGRLAAIRNRLVVTNNPSGVELLIFVADDEATLTLMLGS